MNHVTELGYFAQWALTNGAYLDRQKKKRVFVQLQKEGYICLRQNMSIYALLEKNPNCVAISE